MRKPHTLLTFFFWSLILFLYLPLLYIVFQAFLEDPNQLGSAFTFKWFFKLFDSEELWGPLTNSILVALASATLSTLIGTLGALGFSSHKKELSVRWNLFFTLPIIIPEIITAISLLLFFLVIKMPLGFFTVVIAHASFSASFVFFNVREQLEKLDPQLLEAALDLGASPSLAFKKVILPNLMTGIFGAWLMAFTLSYDDFLISFFTSGAGFTTLPLKIYSLMRIGLSPELNALCLFMMLGSGLLVLTLLSTENGKKWLIKST